MFKKIFSIVIAIALCVSLGLSAQAKTSPKTISESSTVQPYYTYTSDVITTLKDSSGNAKCTVTADCYSSVTKIEITMTLQKKTLFWWSEAESWTTTVNSNYASFTKTTSVSSATYRVKAECVVYSGSNSETITEYSSELEF